MKVTKHITINLGNYESLKIGVEDVDDYEVADKILIDELRRMKIMVSSRILLALCTDGDAVDWM